MDKQPYTITDLKEGYLCFVARINGEVYGGSYNITTLIDGSKMRDDQRKAVVEDAVNYIFEKTPLLINDAKRNNQTQ